MKEWKDVFISYGRRHSKDFATKLNQRLTEMGYNIWFDQNDIPLAVDFQNQIDDGIEKAHNFIFIISPHSVKSVYCLKEITLAVQYNKRIIPILHVEPSDCWDRMHPTIGKINWVYFQDEINDFEESFKGLVSIIESHKNYVHTHTRLLHKSLEWKRKQKNPSLLLDGKDRMDAEEWLNHSFPSGEQAPCKPTDLHSEYICESKKNAQNMMTEVFFCYAREDVEMRDRIRRSLTRKGITSWTDTIDIETGVKFEEAIKEGIEQADNFLYLISPEAIVSDYCNLELKYALQYNKRILPLVIKKTDDNDIPKEVREVQYFDFTQIGENSYSNAVSQLQRELRKNGEYYKQHKYILVQALKWMRQKKNPSILLRGYSLQNAESWLKMAEKRKIHRHIQLQEEFIFESKSKEADLTTEVFISYSRADSDFARKLNDQLQTHGKTTWFDQESIASASDFQQEIYNGIETADNFLFIISTNSIESPYCTDEVSFAKKFNKRFITVLYNKVEPSTMPTELAAVQWIDFQHAGTFHKSFGELLRTLDTDREHVQNHNKWLQRAKDWDNNGRTKDMLIRGTEFKVAEEWLVDAEEHQKAPLPTQLQKEFIHACREAILAEERREKQRARLKQIMLIVMGVLMLLAIVFGIVALHKSNVARKEKIAADVARDKAKVAEAKAVQRAEEIKKKNEELEEKRRTLKAQKDSIEKQTLILKRQRDTLRKQKDDLKAKNWRIEKQKDSLGKLSQTLEKQRDEIRKKYEENKRLLKENQRNYLLSVARNLSNKTLHFLNEENYETATKLAVYGFYLNKENDGPQQNLDNYIALHSAFKSNPKAKAKSKNMHFTGHQSSVRAVSVNPAKNQIVTADDDGKIIVWKAAQNDGENVVVKEILLKSRIRITRFSPDGSYFAALTTDGTIHLWKNSGFDAPPLKIEPEPDAPKFKLLRFSHVNNKTYLFASTNNALKVWKLDPQNDEAIAIHKNDGFNTISALEVSADGEYLLIAHDSKLMIHKLNYFNNKIALLNSRQLPTQGQISAIAINSENTYIAAGNILGTVWIFNIAPTTLSILSQNKFTEHLSRITALSFNPAFNQLASASTDKTVRLWKYNQLTTEDRIVLQHDDWVWDIDYTSNGTKIASACQDQLVVFWYTKSIYLAKYLKSIINKGFSPEEWKKHSGIESRAEDNIPEELRDF